MSRNAKVAIVRMLGGLGVMMILIGALAHVYATTTGVLIAIGLWIACGILSRYWGLKKKETA